ncbi:tetraacyldisaccharide 4'-kinase, partial [bacterium]|nr:tetraacyldisaccharide 4'-kinase [bacterium]
ILTRGYGRKSRERIILPAEKASWRDVGDEPLLLSRKLPGVPIAVHPDRCASGKFLESRADLFILDDGFQHLRLARDLDIVVLDGTEFSTGIFPFGWRRDGLWRLDDPEKIIIAAPKHKSDIVAEKLPDFEVLPFETVSAGISTIDFQQMRPPEYIAGRRVFLCAGIANPHRFERLVRSLGAEVVGKKWFMDHRFYKKSQVERVLSLARRRAAEIVLTTEKDAVKIAEFSPPIDVLSVRAHLDYVPERVLNLAE